MKAFIRFILTYSIITTAFGQKNPTDFSISPIDSTLYSQMIANHVFADHSPIPIHRLKLVKLKYFNFQDEEKNGELIVLDACAKQVLQIFIELYHQKFPLAEVSLMTKFNGNDSLSMAHNNTSAHNLRPVTGGDKLSLHAYGTALDINPVNNPFIDIPCNDSIGIARFKPIGGIKFANRMENRIGKQNRKGMAEEVIDVFAKNGFYWWGGYWNCPIDYQHFQLSRSVSELLSVMQPEEAKSFFKQVQNYYNKHGVPIEYMIDEKIGKDASIRKVYTEDPKEFKRLVEEIF